MNPTLIVTAIQMNSGEDRKKNLEQAASLMRAAIKTDAPDMIFLPEYFDFYGGEREGKLEKAEFLAASTACQFLQTFARDHTVWIHAGSLIEKIDNDARVYNSSVVFDRSGAQAALYRKIHLFDITAPDGTKYHESATVKAGEDVVVYDVEGFKIGCSICYDMRFSGLYQAFAEAGVDIVAVPAAFALQTGKDHWDVLLRARAIETQAYVIAAAQVGAYLSNGQPRLTFGNTLMCDPWGLVVARASDGPGYVSTRLQRAQIDRARSLIPMEQHRKPIRF